MATATATAIVTITGTAMETDTGTAPATKQTKPSRHSIGDRPEKGG
jgi:hypothetical protein